MPPDALMPLLRALAEPTRLWLVRLLLQWHGPRNGPIRPGEPGLCLSDIELAAGLPHPLVSHHLRILRESGVVESEKRGRWTVYRVSGERLGLLLLGLRGLTEPVVESSPYPA
jgi:ArsR family transcriptional regulator